MNRHKSLGSVRITCISYNNNNKNVGSTTRFRSIQHDIISSYFFFSVSTESHLTYSSCFVAVVVGCLYTIHHSTDIHAYISTQYLTSKYICLCNILLSVCAYECGKIYKINLESMHHPNTY